MKELEQQKDTHPETIENIKQGDLLTIQKFILLLNDFHYREFASNLKRDRALLPLKLAAAIRQQLPMFDTPDRLCAKVYEGSEADAKKKFHQLSAYTFRLSFYLACNYPDYLSTNIQRIEQLVNNGSAAQALLLAEAMLEIAERIGDFRSQIWCTNFLIADANLHRDTLQAINYYKQLHQVMENESLAVQLQNRCVTDATNEMVPTNTEGYEKGLDYYRQYLDHESLPVRIHAMYAYVSWVNRYNTNYFQKKEDLEVLLTLEKLFQLHPYLVFPFLSNLRGNIGFIRLHHAPQTFEEKEKQKYYIELEDYYDKVNFTSRFVNGGHIYLLAVECSRLLGLYHSLVHRSDYEKLITAKDKESVAKCLAKCQQMMELKVERKSNEIFRVNLQMLYGGFLLLCGDQQNIKSAISELESLLISYQQMSLRTSTDSTFMVLMIAYFSAADYEGCAHTFMRYNKIKKKKTIYESNDEKINVYYFLSQWLSTQRKQYLNKLKSELSRNGEGKVTSGFTELLHHFGIDLWAE